VDERRQKLAAERGDPPPPPLEPRPPFKPKPPEGSKPLHEGGTASAIPGEESPADRLRRMLEEHRRTAGSDGGQPPAAGPGGDTTDESPAERLAKMLEQRRRSNQIPPGAAPAGAAMPTTAPLPGAGLAGSKGFPTGIPRPRDHLPPPEARKPQTQRPPSGDLSALWQRIEGTGFGKMLRRLGQFYVKVAGVVLWTGIFLLLGGVVSRYALDGFALLSAGDWQRLSIRYNAGLMIPWVYIVTFSVLAAVWIAGAVLVWRKGKPYVWPVLVALSQLALLPVALALALVAGVLMAVMWIVRFAAQKRRAG